MKVGFEYAMALVGSLIKRRWNVLQELETPLWFFSWIVVSSDFGVMTVSALHRQFLFKAFLHFCAFMLWTFENSKLFFFFWNPSICSRCISICAHWPLIAFLKTGRNSLMKLSQISLLKLEFWPQYFTGVRLIICGNIWLTTSELESVKNYDLCTQTRCRGREGNIAISSVTEPC